MNTTAILQIWVNTYVNPAELEANQSRILGLSCYWKELAFLHVLNGKHELVFNIHSTRSRNIFTSTLMTYIAYTSDYNTN